MKNTENFHNLIEQRLAEITFFLEKNKEAINEPGLLNGKLGIALFFFQYSRLSNNNIYEELASTFIDEAFDSIETVNTIDFEKGLSGIGWGIEYLVQNGFVDGDSNEILKELDDVIFKGLPMSIQITQPNCFWGQGLYFCSRLFDKRKTGFNKTFYDVKILDSLLFELEKFFIHRRFLDFNFPAASMNFLLSVLYFLSEVQSLIFNSEALNKIHFYLRFYLEACVNQDFNVAGKKSLFQILERGNIFSDYFSDLSSANSLSPLDGDDIVTEMVKSALHSLFFKVEIQNEKEDNFINEAQGIVSDESFWGKLFSQENECDLTLEKGISGIGFALIELRNMINS